MADKGISADVSPECRDALEAAGNQWLKMMLENERLHREIRKLRDENAILRAMAVTKTKREMKDD